MSTRRGPITTLIDFEEKSFENQEEPESLVRKKSDLSGGNTMWQARLILSTLDPKSTQAVELRSAIRSGDIETADGLLDRVYGDRNQVCDVAPQSRVSRFSVLSTVLPPSPHWRRLEVG